MEPTNDNEDAILDECTCTFQEMLECVEVLEVGRIELEGWTD